MEKKVEIFKKLREALSIAAPDGKKGLNDDGQDADRKSIEEKVKRFRNEILPDSDGCAFRYSDLTAIKSLLQDLSYEYDPDGSLVARVAGGLPKVLRQEFKYDALRRLGKIITSDTATDHVAV